jgi:hypothetical protein
MVETNLRSGAAEALNVFVDNGHNTIKCMKVDNLDFSQYNYHLELPTWLIPDIYERLHG